VDVDALPLPAPFRPLSLPPEPVVVVEAALVAPFPARRYNSVQNWPISPASPSRNGASLSWSAEGERADVAVASTKSMTVGSEAPVRRRRESITRKSDRRMLLCREEIVGTWER
jgi:hypothetical protein